MKAKHTMMTGLLVFFFIVGCGPAYSAQTSAIAKGNISVYEGGQLVDRLTGQNPVTEGALLVCDGKCLIKTTGVSLVGVSSAQLALKNDNDLFNLLVNKGRVDFVITGNVSKIAFYTPNNEYTVGQVMFNASTYNPVRGYMQVGDNGSAEIGVKEGRMVFSTAEGAKTVGSQGKIVLAMADVGTTGKTGALLLGSEGEGAASAVAGATAFSTATIVGGGVVVAAVTVGTIVSNNDDSDVPSPPQTTGVGGVPTLPPVASPNR